MSPPRARHFLWDEPAVLARRPKAWLRYSTYRHWLFAILILAVAGTPAVCAPPGAAGPGPVHVTGLEVGIADAYKPGLWTPVRIRLRADQPLRGQVALIVPDSEGISTRVATPPDQPVHLPAEKETEVPLYTRFGRIKSELGIEFTSPEGAWRWTFSAGSVTGFPAAMASHRGLIVAVGVDAAPLEDAAELLERSADRFVVVTVPQAARLPERWYGYEAVDSVVLNLSRPEAMAGLDGQSPQVVALRQWARLGGRVLVAAGRHTEATLAQAPWLAEFLPGRFQRMISLRQASALENYVGGGAAMPRLAPGDRLDLRVPYLSEVTGQIEAHEANLPLVVRRSLGFGQIIFAAAELDDPTLRAWRDRGLFVRRLLGMDEARSSLAAESTAVLHYGFDDLAGQLRSALDQFPEVPLVSFSLVMGLLVAYLVLVGPGDYFFLRKLVGRMGLTWVTFPLVVAAFCVGTFVLVHRLKGHDVRVNQVDLIDLEAESNLVRGTSWATVFSPRTDRYRLAFEVAGPDGARAPTLAAWFGLPGAGLGGMDPKTSPPAAWKQGYEFSPDLDEVRGLPIAAWATRSLTARWAAQAEPPLETHLREEEQSLLGTVVNRSAGTLENVLLCHRGWVYELGRLENGSHAELDRTSPRRELRTFLTGQRYVIKEGRYLPTPYDRASADVGYILRAMMFHRAAGGRQYTGLHHRYQGFVDVSDLLQAGRAVLVAQAAPEATPGPHLPRLVHDGQPLAAAQRRLTLYRFVFPVSQANPSP